MATPRVLVISIDGFAAFYWRDPAARMPNLRRLAERGAVAAGMETVFPSTTWPTHVSLGTGVRPNVHGVVGNHVLNRATGRAEDLTGDPIYDAADLRPNVRLRKLGLLDADAEGRITRAEARVVMNHGAAYVYVREGAGQERTAREVASELAKLPGVAAVWTADQYAELGLPRPTEHRQVGDVLLEAEEGALFVDAAVGEEESDRPHHLGTHGQRGSHPANHAFFLAAGPAIRRGLELPLISSRDAAPTIASTLGLDMGPVEGQALDEILS